MGFSLVMPLQRFLDPRVEDLSLLFWPGGAREGDLPLVGLPSPAAAPLPWVEVEVGVVLAPAGTARTPVV